MAAVIFIIDKLWLVPCQILCPATDLLWRTRVLLRLRHTSVNPPLIRFPLAMLTLRIMLTQVD